MERKMEFGLRGMLKDRNRLRKTIKMEREKGFILLGCMDGNIGKKTTRMES
jgi:hypothetical protein